MPSKSYLSIIKISNLSETKHYFIIPFFVLFSIVVFSSKSTAQSFSVSTTSALPDSSAMLDIISANKGLLIPRVSLISTTDTATIVHPAVSLMVYNTNTSITGGTGKGYYFYNGTHWINFLSGSSSLSGWSVTGNAGTTAGTNFIGTTDNTDFLVKTNNTSVATFLKNGNVGIGTTSPTAKLHVKGAGTTSSTYTGLFANSSGTPILTIRDDGNVGIGVSSPGSKLDIATDASSSVIPVSLFRPQNVRSAGPPIYFDAYNGIGTRVSYAAIVGAPGRYVTAGNENGRFDFYIKKSGAALLSPTFSFDEDGDIINTTNSSLGLLSEQNTTNFGTALYFNLWNSSEVKKNYAAITGAITSATAGSESGHLIFYTTNSGTLSEKMRLNADGKLGIGTTSPTAKLHVVGVGTTSATYAGLFTNSSGINLLSIRDDGNVGINNATPAYKFDVENTDFPAMGVFRPYNTVGYGSHVSFDLLNSSNVRTQYVIIGGGIKSNTSGSESGRAWFYIKKSGSTPSGTPTVAIDEDGDIINSGQGGVGLFREADNVGWASVLYFNLWNSSSVKKTYSSIYGGIASNTAGSENGYLIFNTCTSGSISEKMRLNAGGNLGIGTTSPSERLEVCGNLKVIGTINASSTINASQSITCSSDVRYKKDITTLSDALDNILKLRGVNYYWRTVDFPQKNFNTDKQIGFIAQELEKVYPEIVTTDKDGYKAIDYSRLTPVLVEGIKELNKKNEEQQLKITNLEATLTKIQAENTNFKTNTESEMSKLQTMIEHLESAQNNLEVKK